MSSPTVIKKLLVRDNSGKLFSVAVCNTDTIFNQVRAKIANFRLGLSRNPNPNHFRISLLGKVLSDEEERSKLAWDAIKELACEGFPSGLPLVLLRSPNKPPKRQAEEAGEGQESLRSGEAPSGAGLQADLDRLQG